MHKLSCWPLIRHLLALCCTSHIMSRSDAGSFCSQKSATRRRAAQTHGISSLSSPETQGIKIEAEEQADWTTPWLSGEFYLYRGWPGVTKWYPSVRRSCRQCFADVGAGGGH